jgi:hypothetical protein
MRELVCRWTNIGPEYRKNAGGKMGINDQQGQAERQDSASRQPCSGEIYSGDIQKQASAVSMCVSKIQ